MTRLSPRHICYSLAGWLKMYNLLLLGPNVSMLVRNYKSAFSKSAQSCCINSLVSRYVGTYIRERISQLAIHGDFNTARSRRIHLLAEGLKHQILYVDHAAVKPLQDRGQVPRHTWREGCLKGSECWYIETQICSYAVTTYMQRRAR